MLVGDVMRTAAVTIGPEESAAWAARLLARHNLAAVPVCGKDGRLLGLITDRDIVLRCVAAAENPEELTAARIMTRQVETIGPAADLRSAALQMARRQVRRLPVVQEGRVVGMLALEDLANSHTCDLEAAAALSEFAKGVRLPRAPE